METFNYISCVILGLALGVGADWLFWQTRFKQAKKKVQDETEAVGQAFNAQIEEKDRQIAGITVELAEVKKGLQAQLASVGKEDASLEERLLEEERKLKDALALNERLPDLEKMNSDLQATIDRLEAEKQIARDETASVEERLGEEERKLKDALALNERLSDLEKMNSDLQATIDRLEAEKQIAREETASIEERLGEEERKLQEAQALNERLPNIEKMNNDLQAAIDRLEAEKDELAGHVAALKARIIEERESFEGGMLFVPGGHYLPASVVRNLTRRKEESGQAGAEED